MKISLQILIIFSLAACATTGKKTEYQNMFGDEISEIRDSVRRGSLEQSVRDLSMLLEMDPKNSDARFLRAVAYQKRNQFELAVEDYQKILKIGRNDSRAHYNLGMLYAFKTNDKKSALKHFDAFLTLEPRHQNAFEVAKIMCSLDRRHEGEKSNEVFSEWGIKQAGSETNSEARKNMIEGAIKLAPTRSAPYLAMAESLETEGKIDEAIKYYEQALEASPTLSEAHRKLGRLLISKGRQREADIHLIKANLFNPNKE